MPCFRCRRIALRLRDRLAIFARLVERDYARVERVKLCRRPRQRAVGSVRQRFFHGGHRRTAESARPEFLKILRDDDFPFALPNDLFAFMADVNGACCLCPVKEQERVCAIGLDHQVVRSKF